MTQMDPKGYDKAHAKIIDYLLQFSLSLRLDGSPLNRMSSFNIADRINQDRASLRPGDLLQVTSMRDVEFRLSWLIDTRKESTGDTGYLLQSVKTGKQCWWAAVSVAYFDRDDLANHPHWRWTNEQNAFSERWFQAARDCDEYLYRPMQITFLDDTVAELRTRERHSFSDYQALRKVLWREASDEQLQKLFQDMEQEHKDRPRERKT